jgi:hypothetical protein
MTDRDETPDRASTTTLPRPASDHRAPGDRVPADQRILGIDKRSIWPGVVLLIVWALWSQVMPWINDQIEVDNPIVAGDVINLGDGEVTFIPAVGWDLVAGALLVEGDVTTTIPTTATLVSETVSYSAKSGSWDGTAEELVDQMIDVNEAVDELTVKDEQGRSPITNVDGVQGELAYLVGVDQAVLIATFVFEPEGGGTKIGVEIEVRGDPGQLDELAEEYAPMITTTTYRPAGEEANS